MRAKGREVEEEDIPPVLILCRIMGSYKDKTMDIKLLNIPLINKISPLLDTNCYAPQRPLVALNVFFYISNV